MSRQDAGNFLEKWQTRKDLLHDNISETLLGGLIYLLLAIAQAAAYLNRTGMSIATYL